MKVEKAFSVKKKKKKQGYFKRHAKGNSSSWGEMIWEKLEISLTKNKKIVNN